MRTTAQTLWIRIPLPLADGTVAEIVLPRDMTRSDWEQIKALLDAYESGIVKADEPVEATYVGVAAEDRAAEVQLRGEEHVAELEREANR